MAVGVANTQRAFTNKDMDDQWIKSTIFVF